MDQMIDLHTVVFDKTGTLTRGVFEVLEIQTYSNFTEEEILEWAALAEIHSHHPIAASIRSAWKENWMQEWWSNMRKKRAGGLKL